MDTAADLDVDEDEAKEDSNTQIHEPSRGYYTFYYITSPRTPTPTDI